jgi:D-alanyl-D-alanine carboxypeptidase
MTSGLSRGGALLALLCLGGCASTGPDEVDRYVEERIRRHGIPGASLVVLRGGEVAKAEGYGFADLEGRAPATEFTRYEIGSLTKQFTAVALLMLAEEGRLRLDDPLTRHLPELPEAWAEVTLRQMLHHTSGILNYTELPNLMPRFLNESLSETEVLAAFSDLPLEFQPGETWSYSNTAYYLLGVVIERASGGSYWEFLSERIFRPLGMASTGSTDPRAAAAERAFGYGPPDEGPARRPFLTSDAAFSAGAIASTVGDMARWDAALRSGKLLERESFEEMWAAARVSGGTPAPFRYGLGWFLDTWHGRRIVHHSGGTPGFSSVHYRFLDDGLAVILLTNRGDVMLDPIAIEIAGMYEPGLSRQPEALGARPETTSRLRGVLERLFDGEHEDGCFTPAMNAFLGTATGRGLWRWIASHGAFGSFVYADEERVEDGLILRYRADLGGNSYPFSFLVLEDDRIAQVYWW